jgi:large subunit ribosomal protein L30
MDKIKVTLIKSPNGGLKKQKRTIEALGLTKIRTFRVFEDGAAVRGMLAIVPHMVKVEKV